MKVDGMNELSKKIAKLAKNVKELDGPHSIPLTELLTANFISKHTRFSDANEMFSACGFKYETQEDFEAIPEAEFDKFIQTESTFATWHEMLGAAYQEQVKKKLGL
jgi:hypothetical protein